MNAFHNPEHARVATAAIDEKRLLPGEDPKSRDLDDARHWVNVYRELVGFKQQMLSDMEARLPGMSAVASVEVNGIDMAIIRRQLQRYERRVAFWEQRLNGVAAAGFDSTLRSTS